MRRFNGRKNHEGCCGGHKEEKHDHKKGGCCGGKGHKENKGCGCGSKQQLED